eukprot:4433526-Pyramimonas_sp.AAC.1
MKYWLCTLLVAGPGGWAGTAPTDPRATFPATAKRERCTKADMLKAMTEIESGGRWKSVPSTRGDTWRLWWEQG